MDANRIVLRIGGIVFSIFSQKPFPSTNLGHSYRDFLCEADPEITVHAKYDGLPEIPLEDCEVVFESQGLWKLYRYGEKHVVVLQSPAFGCEPYRIAVFEDDFRRVTVCTSAEKAGKTPDGLFRHPLEYPLSELLMVCVLARGRGVLTHSCGIDDQGRGYLFAGNSAHGKTTMSRLWLNEALVLNDDRIVLRRRDGRIWMYGTPWHGDYDGVSPRGLPLHKVFFLRHARANCLRRREGAAAVSMLMSRTFLPLWDTEGVRFSLDFFAQLAGEIPCYELGFVPDARVLDFVRSAR